MALIAMPASAPSTIAPASRTRSRSSWRPANLISAAAASGARVLPAAMITAPAGLGPNGRLVASAPAATAGHIR